MPSPQSAFGASLAAICREVALLVGVAPAGVWAGNPDVTAAEVVAWVNQAQRMVADATDWSALHREALWTPEPGKEERMFPLPADFGRLLPDTVRCGGQFVPGPANPAAWARPGAGPLWALRSGKLLTLCLPNDGLLQARYLALVPDLVADGQETPLDARAVTLGAVMLWRDAKGLPQGSAPPQYLSALQAAKAADRPVGALSLGRAFESNAQGTPRFHAPDPRTRRNPVILDMGGTLG